MSAQSSAPGECPRVDVCFLLDAEPSPGLLPRLLQPFARRDVIPDRACWYRNESVIHVEIACEKMPAAYVHLLEGNLRQVVGVQRLTVLLPNVVQQAA